MDPALPPPPGQSPNFANPESLLKWNTLCVSVCLSITTTVFFLRAYTRIAIKREWILEDWLVCVSWSGLVTYCALMTTTMHKHGGVHEWDLTLTDAREPIYWFNVASIEYAPIILCTKLAILLLYRRIFVTQRWGYFDWALRIFMTILVLFYVALTPVKIWQCTPRERIWNKSVPGTCMDASRIFDTSGLFNTITDVMILLVPVRSVWSLHMTRKRKWGVVAVFTVGFTAPVFSLVGFIARIKVSGSPDVTRNYPEILLWLAAEVSSGLICVCIPTLASLSHRRPARPSDSILQGRTNTRHTKFSGPNASTSLGEQELWDRADVELQHGYSDPVDVLVPPSAVMMRIKGGSLTGHELDGDNGLLDTGCKGIGDEADDENRIPNTVRIEHSYV